MPALPWHPWKFWRLMQLGEAVVICTSRADVHSSGRLRYALTGKRAKRGFCSYKKHKHLVRVTDTVTFSTQIAGDEDLGYLPLEVVNGDGNTLALEGCLISPTTAITKSITSKTAISPTSKSELHSCWRREDGYLKQQWERLNTFKEDLDS